MTLSEILPLVIPLVVLQLVLIVLALRDLASPERRVRGGNKLIWVLVIVFGQLIGPILYFLAGREES